MSRHCFCKQLAERLHIKCADGDFNCDFLQLDGDEKDRQKRIGNFVSFVVENDIREIKYASDRILNRRFKDSIDTIKRYPLFDHSRLMVAKDGKYCLVLHPYLKKEEAEDIIKSAGINNVYGVMDSDNSWYNVGKTAVVVIWEDSVRV